MKPNKQRILSSQPTKPGSISRPSFLKSPSNSLPFHQSPSNPITKPSEFQLNDIVKNLKNKKPIAPFKLLQFSEPRHTRTETTIVKDIQQSYKFVSALSYNKLPLSTEEEPKEKNAPLRKSVSEAVDGEEICNNTTDTFKGKIESFDMYFGIMPNKYWCMKCKQDVVSDVKMNLPTLNV